MIKSLLFNVCIYLCVYLFSYVVSLLVEVRGSHNKASEEALVAPEPQISRPLVYTYLCFFSSVVKHFGKDLLVSLLYFK